MEPQPESELEEFEDGAAELVVSRLSPRDVSDLRKSTRGAESDVFERVVMLSTELWEADEDEGSSAFTVYRMRCFTKDDRAWDVQKRFREFIGLRQQLIANGEAPVAKLKFPRRVLWGATESKVVEKRMVRIQAWLNELLAIGMQSVRQPFAPLCLSLRLRPLVSLSLDPRVLPCAWFARVHSLGCCSCGSSLRPMAPPLSLQTFRTTGADATSASRPGGRTGQP